MSTHLIFVFTAPRRFCPDRWFSYQSKCFHDIMNNIYCINEHPQCNHVCQICKFKTLYVKSTVCYLQQITRTANRATAWIAGFNLQLRERWKGTAVQLYVAWYRQSTATSNYFIYLTFTLGQGWRNLTHGTQYPFICAC
ncbi:unnamed protein product [Oncorhynchus mykiss]|uniref:Uncharacterized protein n=1 Tax=Oncorhynchus mykiss TaxID=8022 RepID=A0A060XAU2_ONCMY|nr:unnamed protein product [Oncorhynchus mykiss]